MGKIMAKKEYKYMSKRTVYTLFIAKFLFSLALIFWTIKMTLGAGVGTDDDNAFMSYYKDVDVSYNKIMLQNQLFEELYSVEIIINSEKFDKLTSEDIFLSTRVIQKRTARKNILHLGENNFKVVVKDRKTGEVVQGMKSEIILTMPSTHKHNQNLQLENNKELKTKIDKKSYWNIMGTISKGDIEGKFYIKTNAI
jgi:uncharacterized protein YwbE